MVCHPDRQTLIRASRFVAHPQEQILESESWEMDKRTNERKEGSIIPPMPHTTLNVALASTVIPHKAFLRNLICTIVLIHVAMQNYTFYIVKRSSLIHTQKKNILRRDEEAMEDHRNPIPHTGRKFLAFYHAIRPV